MPGAGLIGYFELSEEVLIAILMHYVSVLGGRRVGPLSTVSLNLRIFRPEFPSIRERVR